MPVEETQGLVCAVGYCLSGSMTWTATFSYQRRSRSFFFFYLSTLFTGVYLGKSRQFWLVIVHTLERREKFSLLNSPPPAGLAVWTVEAHCFSLTEGREQREMAGYLTLKAATLWLSMWPIKEAGKWWGSWLYDNSSDTTRLHWRNYNNILKMVHLILKHFSKGVKAFVGNHS